MLFAFIDAAQGFWKFTNEVTHRSVCACTWTISWFRAPQRKSTQLFNALVLVALARSVKCNALKYHLERLHICCSWFCPQVFMQRQMKFLIFVADLNLVRIGSYDTACLCGYYCQFVPKCTEITPTLRPNKSS